MLLSAVDEPLPLPFAAAGPPLRQSDWCGLIPRFVTAGWRSTDSSRTLHTIGSKRSRPAYTALASPAPATSASIALCPPTARPHAAAPALGPLAQQPTARQQQTDDEQLTVAASLLLRRHSARPHRSRSRAAPCEQSAPLSASVDRSAAGSGGDSGSGDMSVAQAASDSAGLFLSALPRPVRQPLPARSPASRVEDKPGEEAASGALRAAATGNGSGSRIDGTFEAFDYEAALRMAHSQSTQPNDGRPTGSSGDSSSGRGRSGHTKQRKHSTQQSTRPSPAAFARSSRYSGRARGRQFNA